MRPSRPPASPRGPLRPPASATRTALVCVELLGAACVRSRATAVRPLLDEAERLLSEGDWALASRKLDEAAHAAEEAARESTAPSAPDSQEDAHGSLAADCSALASAVRIDEAGAREAALRRRWFALAHWWLPDPGAAPRPFYDERSFRLPALLAAGAFSCLGLLGAGFGLPSYFLTLVGVGLFFLALSVIAVLDRLGMWLVALIALFFPLSFGASLVVRSLWPGWANPLAVVWTSGLLAGIGLSVARRCPRSKRHRMNAYGPFACLWVRGSSAGYAELVLIDSDQRLVWRRGDSVGSIAAHTIGGAQASALSLAAQSGPKNTDGWGEWIQCYSALTGPRRIQGERRAPMDWAEASATTPGLTDEAAAAFFGALPSPHAPPGYGNVEGALVMRAMPDYVW